MSQDRIDTLDTLLGRYVTGHLPLPLHVMVDAHLAMADKNRSLVAGMESAAGMALDGLEPAALTARDRALENVFSSEFPETPSKTQNCRSMPQTLCDFVGYRVDDIPWRRVMPGFKEFDLPDVDGCHVSLFWIKPGRTMPAHTHEGLEVSLILEGAFNDDRGRFARGDISFADESVDHRPVAEKDVPCIGFAVTDGALRLTGPLHQRLGDILGTT